MACNPVEQVPPQDLAQKLKAMVLEQQVQRYLNQPHLQAQVHPRLSDQTTSQTETVWMRVVRMPEQMLELEMAQENKPGQKLEWALKKLFLLVPQCSAPVERANFFLE